MNNLQFMIQEKMKEDKTLRQIARESGVDHSNLSRYFRRGSEPDSKNLVLLAEYFGVDFPILLLEHHPSVNQRFGNDLVDKLAFEKWEQLSHDQKLQAVLLLHELQSTGKKPHLISYHTPPEDEE